ncbi:muts domain V-domain-containing protein [Melampsora americana]|nr:muts domain V-domain-containing protein [Melampsora americana]
MSRRSASQHFLLSNLSVDSESHLGNWTVALTESRGVGREVGIIGIERELSRAVISQLADSPTYVKIIHWLHQRPPRAIVLVAPSPSSSPSILQILLEHTFPNTPLTSLPRSSFSSERGLSLLIDLCSPGAQSTATISEVRPKYYALGAASALIEWMQDQADRTGHLGWSKGCLNIEWISIEGSMLIDKNTAVDLELITNLRSNILAPLTDVETIEMRLDAVQELVDQEEMSVSLRKALRRLAQMDVDKMIGTVALFRTSRSTSIASENRSEIKSGSSRRQGRHGIPSFQDPSMAITRKLEMLRSLRILLGSLGSICEALSPCSSRLLILASEFLRDPALEEISEVIRKTVNEDSFIGIQKGGMAKQNIHAYAIKTDEKNQLLDVAREMYKENISDAIALQEELRSSFHLPTLGLKFENRAGFILSLNKEDLRAASRESGSGPQGLPTVFTNVKKKNQLIANSYQEICLLRLALFRPEFTDTLAISAGRHPIKERLDSEFLEFTPNDTFANEACSFQLVTGPNMSGKSIFLRQIPLLVIMAQNDDLEASLSTFASEMRTMSSILSALSVCENALVIIDELGRGTSPLEGIGLAHAFSEDIIQKRAFCFFATHFRGMYPNVTHIRRQEMALGLDFQHRVLELSVPSIRCQASTELLRIALKIQGIELASIASLPTDVISRAREVMQMMISLDRKADQDSETSAILMRRKVILDVS